MLRILIVDDEEIEREGLKSLIRMYNLPFTIAESENGEKAFEYLQTNQIDILFTDIKMPFMDGLELAEKAREIYPEIKIVIYSAYGEFDYAKRAFGANVYQYILKPIVIDEFIKVLTSIIDICRREKNEKEKLKKLIGSDSFQEFEKGRNLLDFLNGTEIEDEIEDKTKVAGLNFSSLYLYLVMVDFRSKFFDMKNNDFIDLLKETFIWEYDYLNLNERQSIIFIKSYKSPISKDNLNNSCEMLKNSVVTKYDATVDVVFSSVIRSVKAICDEYKNIETVLDYKFFFDSSKVLFACGNMLEDLNLDEIFEKMVVEIGRSIDASDWKDFEDKVELFFDYLRARENLSSTYIKYVCAEIGKKAIARINTGNRIKFMGYLEDVFKSNTLLKLSELVHSVVNALREEHSSGMDRANKKVIKEINKLIEECYMKDISLEWLAEKVYLNPGYLSYLYKHETDQSLIKYITAYRLEKAKELLQSSNKKITDICEKVGFSNSSYFCMIFKSYYGVSPARFREIAVQEE